MDNSIHVAINQEFSVKEEIINILDFVGHDKITDFMWVVI